MARGSLYVVYSLKEELEEMGEEELVRLIPSSGEQLTVELAKKLVDGLDAEMGMWNAADSIDIPAGETEWCSDEYCWQESLAQAFHETGGQAIVANDFVLFSLSDANIQKWFAKQFDVLMDRMKTVTLEEFCTPSCSWELRNAICGIWENALYVNDSFYMMDEGVRCLQRNHWYVATNAILMR